MTRAEKSRPANLWRAFFVFVATATATAAAVPSGPAPDLAQFGRPEAAGVAKILADFRKAGVSGEYYFDFELRTLPRRGDEAVYRGRMWGGRNDQGDITRVELTDAQGGVRRLLVQNGEKSAIWRHADGQTKQLAVKELFEPVIPGVEITAFDLGRTFLHWPDATLERVSRAFRGRPANGFVFRPPAEFSAQNADLAGVRVFLDTQFNALVRIEMLGAREVLKSIWLVDVKRIVPPGGGDEQWIPKSFEFRNEQTRDKARLQVTGAALNQRFPAAIFEPASLAENGALPPAAQVVRIQ